MPIAREVPEWVKCTSPGRDHSALTYWVYFRETTTPVRLCDRHIPQATA